MTPVNEGPLQLALIGCIGPAQDPAYERLVNDLLRALDRYDEHRIDIENRMLGIRVDDDGRVRKIVQRFAREGDLVKLSDAEAERLTALGFVEPA